MNRRDIRLAAACLMLGLAATGCTPVGIAVGAAATAGTEAQTERGLDGAVADAKIRLLVNDAWATRDLAMFRLIGLEVFEGRLLLTGTVRYPGTRDEAVRLAGAVQGVREVIDEIRLTPSGDLIDGARDALIERELRADIMFDMDIRSANYVFDVVNGTIYLLGVAQDRRELDRVIAHASAIRFVRDVVSHVRIKGDGQPGGT